MSETREDQLTKRFGDVLSTEDLATVLRYPSAEAVVKAHSRGVLPVPLEKLPNRRSYFVTARVVAECLDELENRLRRKTMKAG